MPIRMRGPQGQTVDAADNEIDYYAGRGFAPLSSEQEFREAEAAAARPDDRGLVGSVNAAATGFLSGLTLGGSDVALGSLMDQEQRERLLGDRQTNPGISTASEIGGGLAASFAAPGSALARTPAGALARAAEAATGNLRATTTGVRALAGQAAITGAEAAAQNVGSYLGAVAIGDRELTAEGIGGALGTGFAFGAAGGAAALGIEKGTIAARRMFSSVMEGGEDATARAAGEWERRSKDLFDGNADNIAEARRRVDDATRAREAARLDQQRAAAMLDEERALAARAGDAPPVVADDAIPPPAAAGAPTRTPDPERLAALADETADAERAFRERIAAMEQRITRGDVPGEVGPFTPEGGRLAALREIKREDVRAAAGGFDIESAAADAGRAVRATERAPVQATPAPDVPRPGVAAPEVAPAAAMDDDPLMRALMGTKAGLDEGATLGQLGAAATARPVPPRKLADEIDALTEQAARTTDAATKQDLLRRASAIEEQLAPPAQRAMADLDAFIFDAQRYERSMAELAEELGEGASPATREAADALRKAEGEAERRVFDRAAQTVDDHVDDAGRAPAEAPLGTPEGPVRLAPKERVRYAKERKLEANAAVSRARVAESEARDGLKAAQARGREVERAADTVGLPSSGAAAGAASEATGAAGRAADIGAALEVASMLGIPVPSASDIPVIGPIASMYFKLRALKGGADRLMGRVPATGNVRAAAMAASTKDKAARAVDHMLGAVERKAPAIRTATAVAGPRLVEAVRERLHDDGSKAPPKDAGIQEHVAARSREIGALAANPTLIEKQVRREMREVADPDLINAAVAFRTRQIGYLDGVRPKEPPPSPFRREPWKPDKQAAADFARRYAVAMDPVAALEQIEQRSLTPEAAEAYRAVYPLLFKQTQQRLLEQATKMQTALPRPQLTRMSILFGLPLDEALGGAALARTQAAFATTAEPEPLAPDGAPQGAPPVPSIAGPTDLASAYQTASDRRASSR